jgi:hypothetical protein
MLTHIIKFGVDERERKNALTAISSKKPSQPKLRKSWPAEMTERYRKYSKKRINEGKNPHISSAERIIPVQISPKRALSEQLIQKSVGTNV